MVRMVKDVEDSNGFQDNSGLFEKLRLNFSKFQDRGVVPLTYCHIVWHFCAASDARKLECVQEKALRAVCRSKTATYDALLKMVNLPTLRNRRLKNVAILM